jgi:hypothetical protein
LLPGYALGIAHQNEATLMHAAIELTAFWAFGFLTLAAAIVALSIFCNVIDSNMELLSLPKEMLIAAIASLIEAVGVWLIVLFISATWRGLALRGMIIPLILVGLMYRVAHFETWSIFEAGLLLVFQVAISCLVASLISAHFQTAILILAVFAIVLAVTAGIMKSL